METKLLFSFNWDLMILTPLHFVYSLSAMGFIFEGIDSIVVKQLQNQKGQKDNSISKQQQEKKPLTKKVAANARKYAEFFADLST
jgi:hypothetical protein